MDELHIYASRNFLYNHPVLRLPIKIFLAIIWPFNALRLTVICTHSFGTRVKEVTEKGLLKQAIEEMFFALFFFIPPRSYYFFRLFLENNRKNADQFLLPHENRALFPYLNNFINSDVINDKVKFTEFCQKNRLPTVPYLAHFINGEIQYPLNIANFPPETDFIVKRVNGSCGKGLFLVRYYCEGKYQVQNGQILERGMLLNYLKAISKKTPLLAQPRLFNHTGIANLSNGSLSTARIVTLKDTNSNVGLFAAVFQMPVGNQFSSNNGISSPINTRTGVLGKAWSLRPMCNGFDKHPNTGGTIVGKKLPFWNETLTLAVNAHLSLNGFASLGWDVAITDKGPLLLEANTLWNTQLIQRPHNKPLGRTHFPKFAIDHIKKRNHRFHRPV